jgi:hypothetical protein
MWPFSNKKKEAEEAARLKQQQYALRQQGYGEKLVQAVQNAISNNKVFNVMHGKAQDNPKKLVLQITKDDNNIVSGVIVIAQDTSMTISPAVMQATIRMNADQNQDKIHVLWGPYGPENDLPLNQLSATMDAIAKHVREWRLYQS